jgi:AdoMet-dependent heme synthase
MPFDPASKLNTDTCTDSIRPSRATFSGQVVRLVPLGPALPSRAGSFEPDTQCDCACLSMEGQEIPPLRSPVSFFLEMTASCTNRCSGCGNVFADPSQDRALLATAPVLPAKQWYQILDQLQPLAFRLKLTGGEPTLHPEFESIVERIAGMDIPFALFTNGRWTAPKRLIALLRQVPCFEGLLISLHGPTALSHEAFTNVAGSFAETLLNAQKAARAGLQLSLSCVLTRHNWDAHDEMLETAQQIGASSVIFNRYLGRAIPGLTPSTYELKAAIQRIQALREAGERVKLGNCVPRCFVYTGQSGCLSGIALLTIDPWGRVRPCNHSSLLCGSLLEQPVMEIWNAPAIDRWRQFIPANCRSCTQLANCRGGCRAQAFISGRESDPLIRSPFHKSMQQPPQELLLFEYARPVGRYTSRAQDFGTLLLGGNRLFPVGEDMHPLLEMLDGQTTLQQIEASFGQPGLSLIGHLYQQGMVEFLA